MKDHDYISHLKMYFHEIHAAERSKCISTATRKQQEQDAFSLACACVYFNSSALVRRSQEVLSLSCVKAFITML